MGVAKRSLVVYMSQCLGFIGMTGAKSALEVKDDMTFLDLTVRQIEVRNAWRESSSIVTISTAPEHGEPR